MIRSHDHQPDPKLDLVFERYVDVPRELVWQAWTQPDLLKQWFCPKPWQTIDCEIDLRPGGVFRTEMRGPEGEQFTNLGCYLEVIENEKLVWTNALQAGFRPATDVASQGCGVGPFAAVITLKTTGKGTQYKVIAMHADEANRKHHYEMGFEEGWGKAFEQLVELMRNR